MLAILLFLFQYQHAPPRISGMRGFVYLVSDFTPATPDLCHPGPQHHEFEARWAAHLGSFPFPLGAHCAASAGFGLALRASPAATRKTITPVPATVKHPNRPRTSGSLPPHAAVPRNASKTRVPCRHCHGHFTNRAPRIRWGEEASAVGEALPWIAGIALRPHL